ncbi:MarR family transcriptional regulator [Spongiactinospora sp. TRM90649]|uniref:MarR family winged helix-turn-helix transcriptional regulator n=1 Tax=Spongiactinospora sp. TRM90649 TaxID=3031114 RepID=UPI0023F699E8|nr:MarR family transcriptional regulator [Spongiactinospora sp. TRM90649]MDF5757809.1 MarR family transcriptional regulator [Spongiactinospora sp. TRM90649]
MLTNPPKSPVVNLRSDAGLASALRVSLARLNRRLRRQATVDSLTPTQLAALAAIERHSAITPGELAELEKMRPPSMTRVISGLDERGLVVRAPHPTDRRQVSVSVTEEGSALLKEERRRKEAWLTQRLKELTVEERSVLRAAAPILEKLSRI